MNMWIDLKPYHFSEEGIKKIEGLKNATYMGHWCTKRPSGGWNEQPVDVFYVANPDKSKGHTHYFGMFVREGKMYIVDAENAFSDKIVGVLAPDGEVMVSRFRHDFQQRKGVMVDGGRDYLKCGHPSQFVKVEVEGSEFKLTLADSI